MGACGRTPCAPTPFAPKPVPRTRTLYRPPAILLAGGSGAMAIREREEAQGQVAGAAPALFVRLAGGGSAQPLVLLHGLASSSRYWLPYVRLLGGRRLVLPDLLGFGRSPKPATSAYTPQDHVSALAAALTRLRGRGLVPPFDLVGQSAGSVVALHYAT